MDSGCGYAAHACRPLRKWSVFRFLETRASMDCGYKRHSHMPLRVWRFRVFGMSSQTSIWLILKTLQPVVSWLIFASIYHLSTSDVNLDTGLLPRRASTNLAHSQVQRGLAVRPVATTCSDQRARINVFFRPPSHDGSLAVWRFFHCLDSVVVTAKGPFIQSVFSQVSCYPPILLYALSGRYLCGKMQTAPRDFLTTMAGVNHRRTFEIKTWHLGRIGI